MYAVPAKLMQIIGFLGVNFFRLLGLRRKKRIYEITSYELDVL